MDAALAALGFKKSREDSGPISRILVELGFRSCDLMMLGLVVVLLVPSLATYLPALAGFGR